MTTKLRMCFKWQFWVFEYTLTHKSVFLDHPFNKFGGGGVSRGVFESGRASVGVSEGEKRPASTDTFIKTDKGGDNLVKTV